MCAVLNTVIALSRPQGVIDYLNVGSPEITDVFYTKKAGSRDERIINILLLFDTPATTTGQNVLRIMFNPIGDVNLVTMPGVESYVVTAPRGGSLAINTRYALLIGPDPESIDEINSFGWHVDADFTLLSVAHEPFVLQANNGQMIMRHASIQRLTSVAVMVYSELL